MCPQGMPGKEQTMNLQNNKLLSLDDMLSAIINPLMVDTPKNISTENAYGMSPKPSKPVYDARWSLVELTLTLKNGSWSSNCNTPL